MPSFLLFLFFFSSRRRHTRFSRDWSSDVCSSDLGRLPAGLRPAADLDPVEWAMSDGLVPYEQALAVMDQRVAAMAAGKAPELVWLLEHPPLYTAGTSAKPAELIQARFPVFSAGRGGQFTYHGPGQRV